MDARRIDLPFGQVIEFEWEKHSNPSYRHIPASVGFQDSYLDDMMPDLSENRLALSNEEGHFYVDPHSEITSLKSVKWPGGKVTVNYNNYANGGGALIKNITVTDHNSTVAKQCKLSYDINRTHHVKTMLPCLLQSVEISGIGTYSFEYDPTNFNSDTEQDYWGYYNANGASSLIPRIKMWALDINVLREFKVDVIGAKSRLAKPDAMKAYILTKVTYPTGGSSEYEYEPHRFSDPGCEPDNSIEHILSSDNIFNSSDICVGGGLRVKRIITSAGDDSPADIRTYAYGDIETGESTESGLAICSTVPYPSTFVTRSQLYIDDHRSARLNRISGFSNYNHMGYGEPEIWYEYVTEYSSTGKTVYESTRYNLENFYYSGCPRLPKTLYFSSSSSPLLQETSTYAKQGNGYTLTSCVQYDYDIPVHTPAGIELYITRNYTNAGGNGPDFDVPGKMCHAS